MVSRKKNSAREAKESAKVKKENGTELPDEIAVESRDDDAKTEEHTKQLPGSSLGLEITSSRSFESLKGRISDLTYKSIVEMGFPTMTEIQFKSIPYLLEGKDLIGAARTGSGKTLAFLIPAVELIHKLKFLPRNGTGCIILSPTRELSLQTLDVLKELLKYHSHTYGLIMGGTCRKSEAEKLANGINFIVATPGRLLDHLQSTSQFVFKNLQCLIFDEADRMLDIGFEKDMKKIVQILPTNRQTMLFSATLSNKTKELVNVAFRREPVYVSVDEKKKVATVEGLEQGFVICPSEKRFLLLYTFLRKNQKKKVMVFFSSCKAVKFYNELLNYIDIPVLCIHGRMKQPQRTSTFYKFGDAEYGILLCTDVAARGLDIPAVDWIVQYDPPDDPKEYIHRVGRTARGINGTGNALLILRPEEAAFLRYLKEAKIPISEFEFSWSKIADIQSQLETLISKNYFLNLSAKTGYKSCVRSYATHAMKNIFDVNKLDLIKVAQSFGLPVPPMVNLSANIKLRKQKGANRGPKSLKGKRKANKAVIYKPVQIKKFKTE